MQTSVSIYLHLLPNLEPVPPTQSPERRLLVLDVFWVSSFSALVTSLVEEQPPKVNADIAKPTKINLLMLSPLNH